MNKIILAAVLSLCSIIAFSQTKQTGKSKNSKAVDVPFKVAENYFVKNTFDKDNFPKAKITTQKEFESIFGAAAFMGDAGKVTPIDFKKQFVIAVIEKETNYSTTITPVSLKQSMNKIEFTCKSDIGEQMSATIRPFSLIVVDRKYLKKEVTTNISSVTAASPENSNISVEVKDNSGLSLYNNQWIIEHFNNPKRTPKLKNCHIKLDEKTGRFTGNDGCNVINGEIKIEGDKILFDKMIRTQKACMDMEDGEVFVKNLSSINRYEIKGGELFLYHDKLLVMTLESFK